MPNRYRAIATATLTLSLAACTASCSSSNAREEQPVQQAGGGGSGGTSPQGGQGGLGGQAGIASSGVGGVGGVGGVSGSAGSIGSGGSGGSAGSAGASAPVTGGMGAADAGDDASFNPAPFGTTDIHPEKLGLYMIPDIPSAFTSDWEKTKRSLHKVHQLLPDAWIRWDNETGHVTDTPANVEAFVSACNDASIPMIVTASAVDGYNNWWANNNMQPTVSIVQIADGPYLEHADMLLRTYPNVRLVETINEPDTMWFVSDPDNTDSWNYYMTKLFAAMDNDYAHIVGPSVAFKGSQIWNNHAARTELTNFSYHTYDGHLGLQEVGDKAVWVTEYGVTQADADINESPGPNLTDLWRIEKAGKLSGNIEMIFYVNFQRMMYGDSSEGDHFALSGHLRALSLYAALGAFGKHAYLDDAHADFMATDDRYGGFAAVVWNDSKTAIKAGETRTVPATSVQAGAPLYVLRVRHKRVADADGGAAECQPLDAQPWIDVTVAADSVTLSVVEIEPLAAVLVTTSPCAELAN